MRTLVFEADRGTCARDCLDGEPERARGAREGLASEISREVVGRSVEMTAVWATPRVGTAVRAARAADPRAIDGRFPRPFLYRAAVPTASTIADPPAALLDLLACPLSGEPLRLEGDMRRGRLVSPAGRAYPVIGGVPRLLPPDLLGPFLERAFPDVLDDPAVAETVAGAAPPDAAVLETLVAYDYQHVELADAVLPVDEWRATWSRFQPGIEPRAFAGQTVLEVGCGEGRHAWLVGEQAGGLVGLDLSRGVEVARQRDRRRNTLYVQGDLHRPPLRPGAFDALYSNGVLHHTPDPRAAFDAVTPLVRPGGRVFVWVYGLDGMAWWYRASHLTWLRPLSNRLPRPAQVALAAAGTAALEAGVWLPARALRRVGLDHVAERLPFADAADRPLQAKLRRVFDRLNPPVTHYLDADALRGWFAAFDDVAIVDAAGQGWSARGRVPTP